MSDLTSFEPTINEPPAAPGDDAVAAGPAATRGAIGRAVRRPGVILSIAWLALVIVISIFAHQVAPVPPLKQDLLHIFALPGSGHLLGTDELGRDTMSRLIFGGREIMLACLESVAIAVIIGVPLGLLAGYVGGITDGVTSFLVDVLFAIPGFVVLLAVAFISNNKLLVIMAAFGVISSATIVRLVRAATQSARNRLYVDYARITALPRVTILRRHVLPNILGPVVVQVFYLYSLTFIICASLSFLSLGFNPQTPTWGQMVFDATQNIYLHPFLMVPVGLVLTFTVLSLNQIGSAIRSSLPQADIKSILVHGRGRAFARRDAPTPPSALEASAPTLAIALPSAPAQPSQDAVLTVSGLSVSFPGGSHGRHRVVDDVSLTIGRGQTLAIVGESGSGKTMTALALLGLVPPPGEAEVASYVFDGEELAGASEETLGRLRGREIAYVSQEPMVALDPCFSVGSTLTEPLRVIRGMSRQEARAEMLSLLRLVGIADPTAVCKRYPHQLSGGMAQRVAIALALTSRPKLLIADEPTTALDVTIQAEILDLLRDLQAEIGMSIVFVTHDLGVVADMSSHVAVMYAAQVVETGRCEEILREPTHPYTLSLMRAVPARAHSGRLDAIGGAVPSATQWPTGCRFAARCPLAIDDCRAAPVALAEDHGRPRRCIRPVQLAQDTIVVSGVTYQEHSA